MVVRSIARFRQGKKRKREGGGEGVIQLDESLRGVRVPWQDVPVQGEENKERKKKERRKRKKE